MTPTVPDAATPADIPDPAAGVVDGLEFFEQARVLSQAFPEVAADAEYATRFHPLGIGDSTSPYIDSDPALDTALVAGLAAGKETMESLIRHGKAPVVNGWTVGLHMFDYNLYALELGTVDEPVWKMDYPADVRFAMRAVADRLGLWGNNGYEAVYCQAFTDIDGQPLTGSATYTMTFPDRPPVGAFWSITMYDIPNYYLVDNPLGRFSIQTAPPASTTPTTAPSPSPSPTPNPPTRPPGPTGYYLPLTTSSESSSAFTIHTSRSSAAPTNSRRSPVNPEPTLPRSLSRRLLK